MQIYANVELHKSPSRKFTSQLFTASFAPQLHGYTHRAPTESAMETDEIVKRSYYNARQKVSNTATKKKNPKNTQ